MCAVFVHGFTSYLPSNFHNVFVAQAIYGPPRPLGSFAARQHCQQWKRRAPWHPPF